jgi:hypothetical protein
MGRAASILAAVIIQSHGSHDPVIFERYDYFHVGPNDDENP